MNNKISLCIITKNEEKNIRRCLASASGAVDEIIVVDTGSSDNTCPVAEEFGCRVISFPWNGSFSDARNASLENATGDWIFCLDADEEITAESKEALRLLTSDNSVEGYFIKVINYLGGEGWTETCPDLIFRLFRNRREYRFHGAIHEQIVDVILQKNKSARYRIAGGVTILHYGYLSSQVEEKNKKGRNLELISRELTADPKNRLLRYHFGVELFRAERYREAAAELIRAAEGIDPGTIYLPKLVRYLVMSLNADSRPDQALEAVNTGLRLFPDYADLYYYGGVAGLDLKNYGQAWQFFQKALSMPEQPLHYASFAGIRGFRALYQMGRLAEIYCNEEEALKHYIAALRDNSLFTPALESIVRLLRPYEDPEYTKNCLERICDFCTPQASLLIGEILFRQSGYKLALEYIERAEEHQPLPDHILLRKAICLIQQRRYLEAIRVIDRFEPGCPLYPPARLNRLFCFWLRKNRKKVRELAGDLVSLGLSNDTGAVVSILKDSLNKRVFNKYSPGEEGMSLLLDLLLRTLDLGEENMANSMLERLTGDCLKSNGIALGRLFSRYGKKDTAENYLRLYMEDNPESAQALFLLAGLREEAGDYLEACRLYREALERDPTQPGHYINLIRVYEKMRSPEGGDL
ncbi:MAG: glycosyltransferase [Bacillota bacterium]